MTHLLRVDQNYITHPLLRAQKLMTHPHFCSCIPTPHPQLIDQSLNRYMPAEDGRVEGRGIWC